MYVAIEGIDRSGKSTQIELLRRHFPNALFTKEPGGTELGEKIRAILLHGTPPAPLAELFLFLADRSEHIEKVIKPNLHRLIISDRSLISGIAYAKMKCNLDLEELFALNELATEGIFPEKVVFLQLDERELEKRYHNEELDRIEKEGTSYLMRVQEAMKEALFACGCEYIIIDAAKSKDEIFSEILAFVKGAP